MNAFRRDRWSASSGGTHSLLGGQFAVYLRLISPYLSPVYRAASISYQRHINFMLTAARINTLFTTGLRPEAVALRARPQAGGAGTQSLPCRAGEVAPAEQATEGCLEFVHLTKEPQTFGTPPAALSCGHLPYK